MTDITKSQRMMQEDGCPPALFLTEEDRQAAWVANPPKPFYYNDKDDPEVIKRKQMREAIEQEAVRVRNLRFAALKAKKDRKETDTRGMRWNSRSNKWEPDPNSQEYMEMGKWTITPYNAEGAVVQRGITSIADGSGEVAVFGKMGAAYHRCAAGSVKKIIVTNEAGEVLREWNEGGVTLPKPQPEQKASLDKTIKKARVKAEKAETKKKGGGAAPNKPTTKPAKNAKEDANESYKGLHRAGSRKEQAHRMFDELGAAEAKPKIAELGIKANTINSWFASWRK